MVSMQEWPQDMQNVIAELLTEHDFGEALRRYTELLVGGARNLKPITSAQLQRFLLQQARAIEYASLDAPEARAVLKTQLKDMQFGASAEALV